MRLIVAILILSLAVGGCGESDDDVDGPFFRDVRLQAVDCDPPQNGVSCHILTALVYGVQGPATGTCRVYAQARDGESELTQGPRFDDLPMTVGETLRFDIRVDDAADVEFMRWHAECLPGPHG